MNDVKEYDVRHLNTLGTKDYQVTIKNSEGDTISPFHDIPLWVKSGDVARMVIEIPKGTNYKLEIIKEEKLNPIKHDIKNDKVRVVEWEGGYPAHYGALPQTWEDPEHMDRRTNAKGDNDPIDAFDISNIPAQTGDIVKVKILGVYAMIDAGETDWKLITISTQDPIANKINNLEDIEKLMPGKLEQIFVFLRDYKLKSSGKQNEFAFDGKPQNRDFALQVINETHQAWKKLKQIKNTTEKTKDFWFPDKIQCNLTQQGGTPPN